MKAKGRAGFIFWCVIALILAIPAFLINLGTLPFIEDESIRALVALEMRLTENYLVPTYNSIYYNAKPPLFNWILILSYSVFGFINEWSSRFPNLISTILMSFLVYKCAVPHFRSKRYAILAGFFFLTCGRILFWDSFLGLIDITYSMVIFLIFMLIYKLGSSKESSRMYLAIYTLSTIAFFLKGMPIFVFLGGSFLAYVLVFKKWNMLFHPTHFLGIVGFFALIVLYYYFYGLETGNTMGNLNGLSRQSTMRTPLVFKIKEVLLHIITYPFEFVYHFLPWSLFVVLFIKKGIYSEIKKNVFIHFSLVCFLINIMVYWVSPQVYARYVLMLVPLFFYVLLYLYQREEALKTPSWRLKSLKYIIISVVVLIPILVAISINDPRVLELSFGRWYIVFGTLVMAFCAYLYMTYKKDRPILLVIVLLCLRIGFDLIIIPSRALNTYGSFVKGDALRIGSKYSAETIHIYKDSRLDYTSSFYLANAKQQQLVKEFGALDPSVLYIVDTSKFQIPIETMVIDSIKKREDRETLFLVKMK